MPVDAPPTIDELPPAPLRNQPGPDFNNAAAPFVSALDPMADQMDALAVWMGETAELTEGWANDAEASSSNTDTNLTGMIALTAAFNVRHQGSHSTAPTTRNGGAALQNQDLFYYIGSTGGGYTQFNTYIWSTGTMSWDLYEQAGILVRRTQLFTSSGDWTRSAKFIEGSLSVTGCGGGSSGNSSTTGIGGNGGEWVYKMPADVSAVASGGTVAVTVGAGGASVNGSGVNTAGNSGSPSSFGALIVLAGALAPSATARGATVGGATGGALNATAGATIAAQDNPSAIGGSGGRPTTTTASSTPDGAGGLVLDDTSIKGGNSTTTYVGGTGYGAGGAGASANSAASGAGSQGAIFVEWLETL